jgi:hypothetical protein
MKSKIMKTTKTMMTAYALLTALAVTVARADTPLIVGSAPVAPDGSSGPCWNTQTPASVITNMATQWPMGGGTAQLQCNVIAISGLDGVPSHYFYEYRLELGNVPGGASHCVRMVIHFGTPWTCGPGQVIVADNSLWFGPGALNPCLSATQSGGDVNLRFGGCLAGGQVTQLFGMITGVKPILTYVNVIDDYTDPSTSKVTTTTYQVRTLGPVSALLWLRWSGPMVGPVSPNPTLFQGSMMMGGGAAPAPNGSYDFTYQLIDAADPANALNVGPPVTNTQVAVNNGLFTMPIQTDPSFYSDVPLWLSISVKPSDQSGGSNSWTTLNPPLPLSPTPHASYATAAGVVTTIDPSQAVTSLKGLTGDLEIMAGQGAFVTTTNQSIVISAGISSSDRNVKTDLTAIEPQEILSKLASLPIRSWRYTNETANIHHLGPMAQDFKAAFELGNDDRTIAFVDAGGVALAAIQGLNQKVDDLNGQLKRSDAENAELKSELSEVRQLLRKLETATSK